MAIMVSIPSYDWVENNKTFGANIWLVIVFLDEYNEPYISTSCL